MHRPDTSPSLQKVYDEKWGSLSGEERFSRGLSLTRFCRQVCWDGIQERYPSLTHGEKRLKFFERLYGGCFSEEEKQRILRHLESTR